MSEIYDTTQGFAAFAAAAPEAAEQTPVHGVLIEVNDVSNGMSGRPTRWPADVLRTAAESGVFERKPITLVDADNPDQHWGVEASDGGALEIEANVPMEVKVGEISETTFDADRGLVFEGFVADGDAADVIDRGLAQISPVMATQADELATPDDNGAEFEAREIAAVRDVAIVSAGAFGGQDIQPGALSAMAVDALSALFDTDGGDGDTETDAYQGRVMAPAFDGYSTDSWDAPTLRGTYDGDIQSAREAATFVRGDSETFTEMSLFVVDGEGQLNLNALDSAWRLASQTGGVSTDEVGELRAMYENLAEDAMDAGALSESGESTWDRRLTEAASALPTDADGLRGAMARRLADTSPGNRKTVKDGARSVDPHGPLARRVLGNQRGDAVDVDSDPVARQALGADDEADDPDPDPVDVENDPVARQALGLDDTDETDDADD